MDVLVRFYAKVRPFGFWGPVRAEAVRRGLVPASRPDAADGSAQRRCSPRCSRSRWPWCRSTSSCATGRRCGCGCGVLAVLSVILYFTWYRNLPSPEET